MTQELEQALALLFRRFRERRATEAELTKVASLTLNWTKPSSAPNLLHRGVAAGLLAIDGETYVAQFDPNAVEVPFGFRPPASLFGSFEPPAVPARPAAQAATSSPAPSPSPASGAPLDVLIDSLAAVLEGGRKSAVAEVNAKQQSLDGLVTLDVAALLVAESLGVDVKETAKVVLDGMKKR